MSYSRSNQNKRSYQNKPSEDREMFDIVCSDCGNEAQVPFKPDPERKAFCKDCYQKNRPQRNNRY